MKPWMVGLLVALVAGAVLAGLVGSGSVKSTDTRRTECEARGGVFFNGGQGDDLCLDPEVVR